jgi:hypothetical protein
MSKIVVKQVLLRSLAIVATLLPTAAYAADPENTDSLATAPRRRIADSASAASFSLLTDAAQVDRQRAIAVGFGGYDGAAHAGLFESNAEMTLFGPVAIRGGAIYSPSAGRVRPSVGGKVQLLRSAVHGVDGTVGLFYRPEGLTEPEGEFEGLVAIGRAIGRTYLAGNLLYGQDPEGRERDGEIRLSVLRPATERVLVGVDGRCRFDLGSDSASLGAHNEPTFDALGGPTVNVLVGPVALLAEGGAAVRRLRGATAYGPFAVVGVGTIF